MSCNLQSRFHAFDTKSVFGRNIVSGRKPSFLLCGRSILLGLVLLLSLLLACTHPVLGIRVTVLVATVCATVVIGARIRSLMIH